MENYLIILLSLLSLIVLMLAFSKSKINVRNQNAQIFISTMIFVILLFFHCYYDSNFLFAKILLLIVLILNIY